MEQANSNNKSRFQDLPEEFLPREKLIAQGKSSLSNSELIAVFLRTGTKGKNVLEVSADLLHSAGSLGNLACMDARQISDSCKGIGMAKAATLAAAFELGGRAIKEAASNELMNDPQVIYNYLSPQTTHLQQEKIFVLILNVRMRLIACKEISHGILNESIAHPREILRPVILHNAYGFILAHNHPSGDPRPSGTDEALTKSIKEAGALLDMPLIDHVIIGKPSSQWAEPFYSFRRESKLW